MVGLRMAGETVFWTEDILVVVFGMRIAGGKKVFCSGIAGAKNESEFKCECCSRKRMLWLVCMG